LQSESVRGDKGLESLKRLDTSPLVAGGDLRVELEVRSPTGGTILVVLLEDGVAVFEAEASAGACDPETLESAVGAVVVLGDEAV
jgi:hypothetical protein